MLLEFRALAIRPTSDLCYRNNEHRIGKLEKKNLVSNIGLRP
jgi:hypothetical protein